MVYKNPKFDLNKNPETFSCDAEFNEDRYSDDCRLVVGLGPTQTLIEPDLVLKLGVSHQSTDLKSDLNSFSSSSVEISNEFGSDLVIDDGSTSAKSSGGYMPSLILAPRISFPLQKLRISESESSVVLDFSTETASDHQTRAKKRVRSRCSHPTGCIKHGGRKGHVVEGCTRTAEGITPRFFHGPVSGPGAGTPDNHSLSSSSAFSNSTSWLGKSAKRRQMIPPQVLVPSSMKSSSLLSSTGQSGSGTDNNGGRKSSGLVVPEDRVHGGSILSVNGELREAVSDEI